MLPKSQVAAGGGNAGAIGVAAGSFDSKKYDDWIAFHEPKINLIQKNLKDMNEELQEKVSYAMVQSMIGAAADNGSQS